MSNEAYLIISYFSVGLIVSAGALVAYLLLRRSLVSLMSTLEVGQLAHIFRKLFLWGVLLPVLLGFFSVSFPSCGKDTYQKIVADRAYLVSKNQEQLSSSFWYTGVTLLIWGFVILAILTVAKLSKRSS